MKIKTILMGAAAMLAASCASDLNEEVQLTGKHIVLRAGIEAPATRAAVESGKVTWQAKDAISVRLSDGSNLNMTVTAASAGKTEASFQGVIVGEKTITVPTVGVYPAGSHKLTDGNLTINMPAEYTVADNTNANMPMICNFNNEGIGTFKHLGGVMTFTIGMDCMPETATKFVLTATDGQKITGDFKPVTEEDGNQVIQATKGDDTNNSVTIHFNRNQIVNNVLTVNVPLPLGTYKGLKIEILAEDDTKLAKIESEATNTVARTKKVVMQKLTPVILDATAEDGKDWKKVSDTEYEIYTKAGMFWFADQVNTNANTFKNQTVKLMNNIDLENTPWTPVGPSTEYDHEFQGTFDGNNKTISNLYCVNEGQTAGLFGYASIEKIGPDAVAYIKDVTIDLATIASHHYAGAVAAWVQGGYTVQGCTVTNSTITSTVEYVNKEGEWKWDNGDKVGGVVGYIAQNRTTVKDCSVSNSTITGYRDLGGIVGCVATSATNAKSYVTNNIIGENVKVVQDLNNSYKSLPSEIPCGSDVGRNVATTNEISGNAGTAKIIVKAHNTAQAQLALDAATSGRTIELAAGTYDELVLRHTKVTTEIASTTGTPKYVRTLENFTLKAAEGATVALGGFNIGAGHVYTSNANNPALNYVVDEKGAVIQSTNVNNYMAWFDLKNFVIDGLTLTKQVNIGCDSNTEDNQIMKIDGFTLQNCQMIGDESKKIDKNGPYKLIRIGNHNAKSVNNTTVPDCASGHRLENILVKNCKAKEVFQGVYAYGKVDYTVENCEFDDLGHNVLQVGGGKVTFKNNVIKNCNTDRLFRVSSSDYPAEDWIKILNNTITNSTGDASDNTYPYYKTGTANVNITFEGNTMDGNLWSPLN